MNTQFLTRHTCTQETKLFIYYFFYRTIKNTFLAIDDKRTNKLCTNISIMLCMYVPMQEVCLKPAIVAGAQNINITFVLKNSAICNMRLV